MVSGRIPPWFFKSTMAFLSASRASCRWGAESFTEYGILAYGTRSGGSNMPSRMRASNSRSAERVISVSVMVPALTSSSRLLYSPPQVRSVPALTAATDAAPCVATYLWFRKMSPIAPQSLTT